MFNYFRQLLWCLKTLGYENLLGMALSPISLKIALKLDTKILR